VFRAAKELKLQRDPGTPAIEQNSSKNDMGKGHCITSREPKFSSKRRKL
jgi:hypothetical protein